MKIIQLGKSTKEISIVRGPTTALARTSDGARDFELVDFVTKLKCLEFLTKASQNGARVVVSLMMMTKWLAIDFFLLLYSTLKFDFSFKGFSFSDF